MTKYIVFDSYALIAHFRKEKGHATVSELFADIALTDKIGLISVVNVGEIYYMLHRKFGQKAAEQSMDVMQTLPLEIVDADLELTLAAAYLKAKHKMSYADAFAAALTQKKKGTLITGDREFEEIMKEPNFKVRFI